jgi:hypothetical protein
MGDCRLRGFFVGQRRSLLVGDGCTKDSWMQVIENGLKRIDRDRDLADPRDLYVHPGTELILDFRKSFCGRNKWLNIPCGFLLVREISKILAKYLVRLLGNHRRPVRI